MHNATAITTGSANQRPNTPCIRLWIDVTIYGDSKIPIMIPDYIYMGRVGVIKIYLIRKNV